MPHGEVSLGGPGVWVGLAILVVVFSGGIAMLVDAVRRPRYHFGKFGAWSYILFSTFYVALVAAILVIRLTGFGADFAGTIFLVFLGWTIVLGIIAIIYLLTVVFPNEKDRERRIAYEAEHGIEVPDKSIPGESEEAFSPSDGEIIDEQNDGEYFDDVE